MPTSDAGAGACRVVRGPVGLPVRSPAALAVRGDTIDVILNLDGKPRTTSFPAPPLVAAGASATPAAREPADGAVPGYGVACVVVGDRVFCADRSGGVHRTTLEGSGDRLVASSRSGSRIAGALLAGSHAALGYLASRQTSEGWVSEAWLAVDDDVPVRLSEDGSGATSLMLASRKTSVVALAVDARAALTALHARHVTFEGHPVLGEDAVVFVGGPGDHRTAAALALPSSGPGWALLPIAKDIGTFGMALVRVDEPPRVDEPVVWSMYPNGLDPASVATSLEGPRTWVARVRPEVADPGSAKVLEMGSVTPEGTFVSKGVLATAGKLTDVALAGDAHGALWVAWVDPAGSWLERVVCR
ncbi:MAG TPA: hypothetical protein VHS09_00100 [Polyangiaceae bacterium]|nr:hypothetical protein [Polyangiaceae bacterium]